MDDNYGPHLPDTTPMTFSVVWFDKAALDILLHIRKTPNEMWGWFSDASKPGAPSTIPTSPQGKA